MTDNSSTLRISLAVLCVASCATLSASCGGEIPETPAAAAVAAEPEGGRDNPTASSESSSAQAGSSFVSQKRVLTMGEAVALVQASKGSIVVFHLYASWCGPCRYEFPDIVSLGRRYGSQGLKIVAVSLDEDASDLDGFVNSYGPLSFDELRMHNTSDQEFNRALQAIDARFEGGIPYSAIYDRAGRKVTEWTGSRDLAAFESIIQPLL